MRVGVTDPRKTRDGIEWAIQRTTGGISQNHSSFLRDQQGCTVIGMAAQAGRLILNPIKLGPQVGIESIETVSAEAFADVPIRRRNGVGRTFAIAILTPFSFGEPLLASF